MKKYLETVNQLTKQYSDAIKIGFIAGIGVTLIIVSLLMLQHAKETEAKVFSIRATNQREVLKMAQATCASNKVNLISYEKGEGKQFTFQIVCGVDKE